MAVVANVAINVDAANAIRQLRTVDQAASGLNKGFAAAGAGAKGLGTAIQSALGPLLAVTAAVASLKQGFDLLGQKEADVANLERGLKGLVANTKEATQALVGIADQLGKQTLFNEEDFTQGFKLLTSFRSIGTDSYERVAVAAADVATVTNQDVNQSLMQLAKALQDPEKGLTALARSGTQFTAQQKEQIKALVDSGDQLGAQNLILKEIEAQYGGAAKAAGSSGFAGVMDTLGEVTRDLQRAFAAILQSPLQSFFSTLGRAVERIAEGYEWLNNVLKTQILPIVQPLIDKFAELTGSFDITTIVDLWQGGLVIAVRLLASALQLVVPAAIKILETLAAIGENPVFKALIAPLKAVINGILGARTEMTEFTEKSKGSKEALEGVKNEATALPEQIDKATEAQNRKVAAVQQELTAAKKNTLAIEQQIKTLDLVARARDGRFQIEKQLNDLQIQQLERQYSFAKTENERLRIATQILREQLQGAQIEYNQAIARLQIERQKFDLQIDAAVAKQDEIIAESKLQQLKAQSIEDEAKRLQKLREIDDATVGALDAQGQVIQGLESQLPLQNQILRQEAENAKLKFEANKLTAQGAFEQKAVSKEIGLSEDQAVRLSGAISQGVTVTGQLQSGMAGVAGEAANAAQQIQNAINLQNMLRSGGNENGAPQQAAEGAYWSGGFKAFADGGVVSKPTLGLVGEGGESEYIIPASKMDEAMSRYAQGQRGSSVIPSSINPQVNVTTGPVMNMNGSNYVSQQDFMTGLQAASRRGAELALNVLQKSNNARRAVGI